MPNQPPKALEGVCILDLSRILAGPYATMVLSDFGADVIKVETPGGGDGTRQWGPPYAGGESAYYLSINRNKRSVTANLKHPQGLEIIHRLAQKADVVIENFRVGQAERLGVGYDALSAIQPGIIYCSISGYGQDGPLKDRPGYDFAIQAQGGIMSISGPEDGPPSKVGVAIVDVMAGMHAATAILAALQYRNQTGEGQHIDISLLDTQLSWLVNVGQAYLVTGEQPGRYGNGHPTIVPYQTFDTADGMIALAVGNDGQFRRFCEVIGQPDLAGDPRFSTNPQRVLHRQELVAILQAALDAKNMAEWVGLLVAANVPVAPVNSIPQALAEPQVKARGLVQQVSHLTAGDLSLIGPPARLSATPTSIHSAPPFLGQHTNEVLAELGYTDEEITKLWEQDVI